MDEIRLPEILYKRGKRRSVRAHWDFSLTKVGKQTRSWNLPSKMYLTLEYNKRFRQHSLLKF